MSDTPDICNFLKEMSNSWLNTLSSTLNIENIKLNFSPSFYMQVKKQFDEFAEWLIEDSANCQHNLDNLIYHLGTILGPELTALGPKCNEEIIMCKLSICMKKIQNPCTYKTKLRQRPKRKIPHNIKFFI